jgi:excisionase family DNA binding protein
LTPTGGQGSSANSAPHSRDSCDGPRDISIGVKVATAEELAALLARVAHLEQRITSVRESESPYMTVVETANFLRCSRQRVDDLLSQRRLSRYKDGSRTLISRAEIDDYLKKHRR